TFIIGFGDIRIPGIENLKIAIDSLAVDNPAATIDPAANLQLGAAVAEQNQAKNIKLPTAEFSIAGLGIGGLNVGGFGVPTATLDSVNIGKVTGAATP